MVNFLVILLSGVLNSGVPAPVVGDPLRCGSLPESVSFSGEIIWVVDGVVRDESYLEKFAPLLGEWDRSSSTYRGDNFHSFQFLCRETFDPVTGAVVAVSGIGWMMTREDLVDSGAKFLLAQMAEFQEGYRARTGEYARRWDLPVLYRTLFPGDELTVEVEKSGWSATINYAKAGVDTVCHIVVGSTERPNLRLDQGAPGCFPSGNQHVAASLPVGRGGFSPW